MRKLFASFSRVLLLVSCVAAISISALAQSQATSGNIQGRVTDPNGAVVPNATVTATNEATGLVKTATTNQDGDYRIILLPPGSYMVKAAASGFQHLPQRVIVTVGAEPELDISLSVAAANIDPVIVSDAAPVVETTRTSISTTINQQSIDNLPINGRNFQDFATLSPAVVRDPRGGDLSVGGQRGTFN